MQDYLSNQNVCMSDACQMHVVSSCPCPSPIDGCINLVRQKVRLRAAMASIIGRNYRPNRNILSSVPH